MFFIQACHGKKEDQGFFIVIDGKVIKKRHFVIPFQKTVTSSLVLPLHQVVCPGEMNVIELGTSLIPVKF